MKKFILLLFLCFHVVVNSQEKKQHFCGSDELLITELNKNDAYKQKWIKENSLWQKKDADFKPFYKRRGSGSNTPPPNSVVLNVVFHDMTTALTPSTSDYNTIVNALNTIYSGSVLTPIIEAGITRPDKAVGLHTFIQFCLATQDIHGDLYPVSGEGGSRHPSFITVLHSGNAAEINNVVANSGSTPRFPTSRYINIYIVDEIAGATAGFATMPSSHGTTGDGIFIEREFLSDFSVNGSNLNYNMNVLAHEMGHYLGLFHVFGICNPDTIDALTDLNNYNPCSCDNANCLFNGDMVCDTPPSMLEDPRIFLNTCHTDITPGGQISDEEDARFNYMDYGDWYIQFGFSPDQIERMHFMIDATTGPRRSLLGPAACVTCDEMNLCQFAVSSPILATNNQIVIGNSAVFTPEMVGCSATITYSWELILLGDTNTTVNNAVGATYTSAATLIVGNYRLVLRATSNLDINCFEEVGYNFSIIPLAGSCNLVLPSSSSDWGNFNRVSYQGGWTVTSFPPNWTYGSAVTRSTPSQTTFDSDGFDIVNSTISDPNFPPAQYPNPAGVTSLMRVGRVLNTGVAIPQGNAYYVSYTFHVSRENCKFRIHSLGMREATGNQNIQYNRFNLNYSPENAAAFGYVSQYKFTSPVSTVQNPVTVGMSENGTLIPNGANWQNTTNYGLNDMVSEFHNNSTGNFTPIGNFRKMNAWSSQDLDFSEFADLNTDITITFFAHSNDASNAIYSAYSYFGIECLGGGMPKDIVMELPDISIPCSVGAESCVTFETPLPMPAYGLSCEQNKGMAAFEFAGAPFGEIRVSKLVGGVLNSYPYQLENLNVCPYRSYKIKLCLTSDDVPFEDFRIEYVTLNKTLVQMVRVYAGFYHQTPPCAGAEPYGGNLDSNIHTTNTFLWCPGTTAPTFHLTNPCFIVPDTDNDGQPNYTYQWSADNPPTFTTTLSGATQAEFTPTESDFITTSGEHLCVRDFVRKTVYTDPYCGTPNWQQSDSFTVYNLGGYNYSFIATAEDICLNGVGSTLTVTFTNFRLKLPNCIPPGLINTANSTVTVQLSHNGQLLGSPQLFNISNFNGATGSSYLISQIFELSFDNMTNSGPIFGVGDNLIDLIITSNIAGANNYITGCSLTREFPDYISFKVKPAAVGGEIQVFDTICSDTIASIQSISGGYTEPQIGYLWEVASSVDGPFFTLTTSGTLDSLSNFDFSIVQNSSIFIRRKSFGTAECSDVAYSNIVQIIRGSNITPTFSFPTTLCNGVSAPSLPTVSDNGISGSWSPPTIGTNTSGTYTFTPSTNQCANTMSITTTIGTIQTPTFNLSATYCQSALPTLSNTSNQGIGGIWTPATVTASGNYVFQPNVGECASTATFAIAVVPITTPDFSFETTYCVGAVAPALPLASDNSIVGTWSPATVNTSNAGTFPYTFTATVNGACSFVTVNITIRPVPIPSFSFPVTICAGTNVPILPLISDNGVAGSWSPSAVSNSISGAYTFTSSDACVAPVSVYISISTECGFYLSWGSDVGCEFGNAVRKLDSNIQDAGCLRVCENSVITYTINGNYSVISSIDWNVTGGSILSENFPSVEVQWGSATYATLQFVISFTDGSEKSYSLCVQKLNKPVALFGVLPDITKTSYSTCAEVPVHFENLSTSNAGNDTLYYNWNFGDGTSSSEAEPSHTYNVMGEYTVTLTAYNGCSCVDTYTFTVYVEKPSLQIECVGVACAGDRLTYKVPFEQGESSSRCDFVWTVTGGTIDHTNGREVTVVWDQIDQSGFGYISVQTQNCDNCAAANTIKIPVVTKEGAIQGRTIMCQKAETTYSLPQWPSTEFEWELNDFGTSASLIASIQRNEVLLKTGASGTILLTCRYKNTLLGCTGTATLEITVQPTAILVGEKTVCENTVFPYRFINEVGNTISNIIWTVTGPQDYLLEGSASNFDLQLPSEGIYNIEIDAPGYCSSRYGINVKKALAAPTAIGGLTTVCPGIPVTYTCAPMEGAVAYWVVENGTIAGEANSGNEIQVNFNPLATGPYIVKVYYKDEFCSSAILSTTVLRDIPAVVLQSGLTSVCGSTSMDYIFNDVTPESYIWSIDPASAGSVETGQNTNEPSILWNQQANNNVSIELEVKKCGKSYFFSYPIIIYNAPLLALSVPTSICNGSSFDVDFSLTPAGPFTSILVDYGDNSQISLTYAEYIANPNALQHAYTDAISNSTTRTVSVTVRGASGCLGASTSTANIVVSPTPVVTLSPVAHLNLCSSESAFNTASHFYSVAIQSGFGQTYTIKWYRAVGNTVTEVGQTATIDAWTLEVGTYWAVVTNNFGCSKETQRFQVVFICAETACFTTLEGVAVNTDCGEIHASISVPDPNALGTFWGNNNLPGAIVDINNPNTFIAHNIEPGNYNLLLCGEYLNDNITCIACKDVPLVIPYKAGLKYEIVCQTDGLYKVTLLDHSVYNPNTPITSFEFTTDGGITWVVGIPIGGISTHVAYLTPGTNYQVGIRISRPGLQPLYPPCVQYETLALPALPDATFTVSTACQGSATEFFPAQLTGVEYLWTFNNDISSNLQQYPVKTFLGAPPFSTTLLVTNSYGCSDTKTKVVSIISVGLEGRSKAIPFDECEGGIVTVTYEALNGTATPITLEWYKDQLTASPIAITPGNQGLPVTVSGSYFAHAVGSNGCKLTDVAPVTVMFVPTPDAPQVDGTPLICQGGSADVMVPTNSSVRYTWTLDGVAQPQWYNRNRVRQQFLAPGTYTFSVVATATTARGTPCTSPASIYVVTVTPKPDVPQISFELTKCNPYRVRVFIVNEQSGVDYYWSNGGIGVETEMTHGGPIRVRAVLGECIEVAQIDLPLDLETLAWVFPKGCYEICKGELPGYMIGPLGSYHNYGWVQQGEQVITGSGDLPPFGVDGNLSQDYALYLETPECNKLLETMAMTVNNDCKMCETNLSVKDISKASTPDGLVCWYVLDLEFNSTNQGPIMLTLTAPNGEGYFSPNTILIPSGISSATVAFFPSGGFAGGAVQIFLNGRGERLDCFDTKYITFPVLCIETRPSTGVNMRTILTDLLLVAPNPAHSFTTVYYDFGAHEGEKLLELFDYLGRKLFSIAAIDRQGQTIINTENYADGSYFIFMKVNGKVVKKTKLLIRAH